MSLPSELGEELTALVQTLARPLAAVSALSRRGADNMPTAFRLDFADGGVLKACRLVNADKAIEVEAIAATLGPLAPGVVARGGEWLLTEWIAGDTLAAAAWSDALLHRCGAAQALVHRRVVDGMDAPDRAVARWRRNTLQVLTDLGAADVLTPGEVTRLAELVQRHAPASCEMGMSLSDYCPENIVCRADGEPCLIDLETLSVTPCDYDLGRTWYRWPMSAAQRAAYLGGYAVHRDPTAFLAHRPFWLAAALIQGAWFRHQFRRDGLAVPVAGLRDLLREDGGE